MRGEESVSLQSYPTTCTRCISRFHTDAAQESLDDFLIHGCISSGGATGLDSLPCNAACSGFAPSQDRID